MALELPATVAQSWRPCGTRTAETNVAIAEITAEMALYEPLEPVFPEQAGSDVPIRSLFTVDLDVSPPLSTIGLSPAATLSKAAPAVKSQFCTTIEDEGLVVEDTRDSLEFEAANGATGRWYVLDVAYPLEGVAGDGSTLATEANVAVWPTETRFGIAGGLLPLETVSDPTLHSDSESVSGLEVDPNRDRETISQLIRTIDVEDASA